MRLKNISLQIMYFNVIEKRWIDNSKSWKDKIFFFLLFLQVLTRQINVYHLHLHIQTFTLTLMWMRTFTLTWNVNKFITFICMMGISKTIYIHNTNSNLSIFPIHVTIARVIFPITPSFFNVCFQLLPLFLLP